MAAARNSFGGRRDLPLAGEPSMEARAPAPHLSHAAARMVRKSPSLRHWMASREVGGLATGLEPRHGGLAPCLRPRRREGLAAGLSPHRRWVANMQFEVSRIWSECATRAAASGGGGELK